MNNVVSVDGREPIVAAPWRQLCSSLLHNWDLNTHLPCNPLHYRKQTSVARGEAKAELLPVTLTQTTSLTEAVLRATMRPARVQASSEDFSQKS
jgi:hypothetical protein